MKAKIHNAFAVMIIILTGILICVILCKETRPATPSRQEYAEFYKCSSGITTFIGDTGNSWKVFGEYPYGNYRMVFDTMGTEKLEDDEIIMLELLG